MCFATTILCYAIVRNVGKNFSSICMLNYNIYTDLEGLRETIIGLGISREKIDSIYETAR